MKYLKMLIVENEEGKYQGQDGKRYNLIYGTYAVGPRAKDFLEFDTLEKALESYGLTKVEEDNDGRSNDWKHY